MRNLKVKRSKWNLFTGELLLGFNTIDVESPKLRPTNESSSQATFSRSWSRYGALDLPALRKTPSDGAPSHGTTCCSRIWGDGEDGWEIGRAHV